MPARTILVADEDTDTRIILRTVLERHRFAVVEAANAAEAINASNAGTVDLVILNYPMHAPDGRTLVHCLRDSAVTKHVPILNLTSRVVPQFLQEAAAEGVSLTLPKPIDVGGFIRIVNDLLEPTSAGVPG